MNNPVVVITGATGLTGQAAARAFAAQGASLALISRNPAKLNALVDRLNLPETRLLTHVSDLRRTEEAESAARFIHTRFGRADILLHLVGGWTGGKSLHATPSDDLQAMLEQHVWTTFYTLRAFTPAMAKNGWGRVVVVSSPLAEEPAAGTSAYAAAKAAQQALIRSLAAELRGTGVTANLLQVRAIEADTEADAETDTKADGKRNAKSKGTTPEEIVAAMLYLCSDQAARINGARIPLFL